MHVYAAFSRFLVVVRTLFSVVFLMLEGEGQNGTEKTRRKQLVNGIEDGEEEQEVMARRCFRRFKGGLGADPTPLLWRAKIYGEK